MTKETIFSDNPNHQEGQTSSIGGIWPPENGSFGRIKAFYNRSSVLTDQSFTPVQSRFQQECRRLGPDLSRIQFRVVIGDQFLRDHFPDQFFQDHLEALFPLERTESGQQLLIAYFGANHASRQPSPADLIIAKDNYDLALTVQPKSAPEIFSRAQTNGFSVEILDKSQDPDRTIHELSQLYSRFNWDPKDVVALVANPANLIAVARNGDTIVSAGIAELARIPFPGSDIRMAEVTEAATQDGYSNQGLYTAVSTRLLVELAQRSAARQILDGQLDVVFGECNALSLGVLKAVRYQGRTFSAQIMAQYGFPGRGLLPQQVPISGVDKQTAYNDLLPAFLTPGELYRRYLL